MNDELNLDHFLALDPETQFAVWDEVGKLYEREESFFLSSLYRILAERFPEVDAEKWVNLHDEARREAHKTSEAAQKELQGSRHLAGKDADEDHERALGLEEQLKRMVVGDVAVLTKGGELQMVNCHICRFCAKHIDPNDEDTLREIQGFESKNSEELLWGATGNFAHKACALPPSEGAEENDQSERD